MLHAGYPARYLDIFRQVDPLQLPDIMLHSQQRSTTIHSPHYSRTFWTGALSLLVLAAVMAWHYRDQDQEALLMKKYLLHALMGAILLVAYGVFYQRYSSNDSESQFFTTAHFWLTFGGILGLMSNELLIPAATLGWTLESLNSPSYYFLHISTQAVIVPIGGLSFLLGQGYFVYRLGINAARTPEAVQYFANGEMAS